MIPKRTPFYGYKNRYRNLRKEDIQMQTILQNLFADHAYSSMPPRYRCWTQPCSRIDNTSWMESSCSSRKDAQLTNSHTTTPSHELQDTPCHFRRTIRPGLVRNHHQISCWHVTQYIVHRQFYPWEVTLRAKVVPWHSHTLAISILFKTFKSWNPTTAIVNTPNGETHQTEIKVEGTPALIRLAQQALLRPHT